MCHKASPSLSCWHWLWEFGAAHGVCRTRSLAVPIHTSTPIYRGWENLRKLSRVRKCHVLCTLLGGISTKQTCWGVRGVEVLRRGVRQVRNMKQQRSLSMNTQELLVLIWLYTFQNNTKEKYLQCSHRRMMSCNETWIRQEWGRKTSAVHAAPSQQIYSDTTLLRMMFSRSDSQSTTTSLSFFFSSSWKSMR